MHVQFVEGRPSDIIQIRVGDYILEESGETTYINMDKHIPSRSLNYTKKVKKELRSALRLARQLWGAKRNREIEERYAQL